MPANRPATDLVQSLRPLFSWMTSTPPRASGASAHAACSSPWGPAQVIGVVDRAPCDPGGGALAVAGSVDLAGSLDGAGASAAGVSSLLHAAIRAVAAAVPMPSRARRRRASRLDSRPSTWSVAISSAM
jgi:hypothetical protein